MRPDAGGSTTPKDEWGNLSSQATGNLAFDSVENIYGDYSRTLRIWGENFLLEYSRRFHIYDSGTTWKVWIRIVFVWKVCGSMEDEAMACKDEWLGAAEMF